ncbi:MAG TPA: hypothetical protein VGW38_16110, partial [Chloroflexota bacterium]|nr:hypothetical protein [Chloroflexota bacterium]
MLAIIHEGREAPRLGRGIAALGVCRVSGQKWLLRAESEGPHSTHSRHSAVECRAGAMNVRYWRIAAADRIAVSDREQTFGGQFTNSLRRESTLASIVR